MLKATALSLLIMLGACEVFRDGAGRPRTALSEREFVDAYVALVKARTPEAKAQVLEQHETTQKEMEDFLTAYAEDLPALSEVFDSIVARQGVQADVPMLP